MELDFPNVRAQAVCPLCQNQKEVGLLVCWPCYHKHELRYGNQNVAAKLRQADCKLLE